MGTYREAFSNRWSWLVMFALAAFVVGVIQGSSTGLYLLKGIAVLVGFAMGSYLARWKKPSYTVWDLIGAVCIWFCFGVLVGVIAGIAGFAQINILVQFTAIFLFMILIFISNHKLGSDLYCWRMSWIWLVAVNVMLYCVFGYIAVLHLNRPLEIVVGGGLGGVVLSFVILFRWHNAVKQALGYNCSNDWLIQSSILPKIR